MMGARKRTWRWGQSLLGQLQGRMTSRRDITPDIKVMDLHDRLRYGENDHIC
jgi:hypothetical protein